MQKPIIKRLAKRCCSTLLVGGAIFLWSFMPSVPSPLPFKIYSVDSSSPNTFTAAAARLSFAEAKLEVYDSLHLEEAGLSRRAFQMALNGMSKLIRTYHIKENILSIVDFSQPSIAKRLYVIDLDNYTLLFNTLVAHGNKTGKEMAQSFSNKNRSNKSSLGFYITGGTYMGNNGYSLKLQGVEKGINDMAYRRAIVLHGADYVSTDWAAYHNQDYIGRSQGCPAVPAEMSESIINELKDGTCLFIYHPTSTYKAKSHLVK
ncbi:MAG: murein L,D-transpeptidase catalytic domain family protein [Chitinophagaceae bacterium]